ncbi:MAG: hypothetical protein H8K09_08390 [Nitrospira sp.]|jgi:hypothetical protein|nr:hypothetical protein [Nitrospira sp.]ULA69135.1 MAG: conserved exported protein of unknown function [Nitrospira sp.]
MMRLLAGFRRVMLVLPLVISVTGCAQSALQGHSSQEDLGMGIVSGTLGAQSRSAVSSGEQPAASLVGQVQAVEGGAYLVRDVRGQEHRIPHDENTRIDRPAHVGDRIQSWFDRHGRAVLIRSLDEDGR